MSESTPPRLEELLGTISGADPDGELDRAVLAQSDIHKEFGFDLFETLETDDSQDRDSGQELLAAAE